MRHERVVVLGAGPAGLAVAACLVATGLDPLVLERGDGVGRSWRRHYDRLHLNTPKALSHLPGLRFPRAAPTYPSRAELVAYLEHYARRSRLRIDFGCEVGRVAPARGAWRVEHSRGELSAASVVVATGNAAEPIVPRWPGIESFPGAFLHSGSYRNGRELRGRQVLVVGFGCSAGEIGLDLAEHGARPVFSVRGGVNVVPRDLMGIPMLYLGVAFSRLPPVLLDAVSRPFATPRPRELARLGLRRSPRGPARQTAEKGRLPLIDAGTIDLLRRGGARVRPAIERFEGAEVRFVDGSGERFDAVIAATGFRAGVDRFLDLGAPLVADGRLRLPSGTATSFPGLYFCGFEVVSDGMLRRTAREARRLAPLVAGRERALRSPGRGADSLAELPAARA